LAKEFMFRRKDHVTDEDDAGAFRMPSPFNKPVQRDAPAFIGTATQPFSESAAPVNVTAE
jgi:hypothetical protein